MSVDESMGVSAFTITIRPTLPFTFTSTSTMAITKTFTFTSTRVLPLVRDTDCLARHHQGSEPQPGLANETEVYR